MKPMGLCLLKFSESVFGFSCFKSSYQGTVQQLCLQQLLLPVGLGLLQQRVKLNGMDSATLIDAQDAYAKQGIKRQQPNNPEDAVVLLH